MTTKLRESTLYRGAYLAVSLAVLFMDQWTKGIITRTMEVHQSRTIIPNLFDLTYVSPGNKLEQPYMVHCAKAGSLERFIGIMVEHYAGAFPAWLAPVQVTVAPVADRHLDYAEEVAAAFTSAGLRVEVDRSSETVGDKIRRAITHKHPSVVVVGDRDIEDRTVGLRLYGEERDTRGVALDEAVARIAELAKEPE